MKHTLAAPWVVAISCLAFSLPAQALRCGTRLISEGDHVSKLLRYCGEPYIVQSRRAQRAFVSEIGRVIYPGFFEEVVIEEWTYNFGPRKLMRIVTLENGQVTHIQRLGYGFLGD